MIGHEKNSINSAIRAVQANLILVMVIILIAVTVAFFFVMNDLVNIKIMQTDTLNQLMDLQQELDDLKTEEESSPPAAVYPLTDEERDLLERVVAAEARKESLTGQEAVAQVIFDRAVMWKLTPAEVIQAPGQFADPFQGVISPETKLAVSNVFDRGIRVFDQPVTHFAIGEPYWAKDKINRGSIGVHSFYY